MMKRRVLLFLLLTVLIALIGCGRSGEGSTGTFDAAEQAASPAIHTPENPEPLEERGIEALKEQYPEYFELSPFKGIEVYVWETEEGAYRCGMMSGTNRMKTAPEIRALAQKSLSVAEAKAIMEEIGIQNDRIFVIPVTQPYENGASDIDISQPYVIDEEHAEQIYNLFTGP